MSIRRSTIEAGALATLPVPVLSLRKHEHEKRDFDMCFGSWQMSQ